MEVCCILLTAITCKVKIQEKKLLIKKKKKTMIRTFLHVIRYLYHGSSGIWALGGSGKL